VLAVAGIADPVPFYGMLREQEVELIQVLSFPDHHAYTQADWQTI
jgi:tetraacyldisaccharide-1-P 4'-kinase